MDRIQIAVALLAAHISRGSQNTHNGIPSNGGLLEGGYDREKVYSLMAGAALDLADELLRKAEQKGR